MMRLDSLLFQFGGVISGFDLRVGLFYFAGQEPLGAAWTTSLARLEFPITLRSPQRMRVWVAGGIICLMVSCSMETKTTTLALGRGRRDA
jgi:hypothetical protein